MRFLVMAILALGLPLGGVQAATVSFSDEGEVSGGKFDEVLDLELALPFFDAAVGILTGVRLTYGFTATSAGDPDLSRAFDDSSEYHGICALDAQLWVDSDSLPVGGSDAVADGYGCEGSYFAEANVGETFLAGPSFLDLFIGTGSFILTADTFHEPTNILNFATGLSGFAEVIYEYEAAPASVPLPLSAPLLTTALALVGAAGRRHARAGS